MIRAGTVLSERFEIKGELGRGGTATVFLAFDRRLQTEVALKILHGHLVGDLLMRDRLSREVQACRRLSHPNILPVFELHESDGHLYLAMAYHGGMTLGEWLSEKGPMPVEDVKKLGVQIADALQTAHMKGVLHRDIKPHNLLLSDDLTVQLTDFGFARLVDLASMTASTHVMGTPGYVGPEIYAGARWEPRSDLYSMGAVMYEALTGRAPFQASHAIAVIQEQNMGPPTSCRVYRPDVPEWLDALILSLLNPNPDMRPDGAEAVRSCLVEERAALEVEWNFEGLDDMAALESTPEKQAAPVEAEQQSSPPNLETQKTPSHLKLVDGNAATHPGAKQRSIVESSAQSGQGGEKAPESTAPQSIPGYGHPPSRREMQLYLWLRRNMDRVRQVYHENHSQLPRPLQDLEEELEGHNFEKMSIQLTQLYGSLERQGKVLQEDGLDGIRAQLNEMRQALEEPTDTWLYAVEIHGARQLDERQKRGRRKRRGKGYLRRGLSEPEMNSVIDCMKAESLWESEQEEELRSLAVVGHPFNLVEGLPIHAAKRLQKRLQGKGIGARVHSPRFRGTGFRIHALLPAVLITGLLGLIELPFMVLFFVFGMVYWRTLKKSRGKKAVINATKALATSGMAESVDEAQVAASHYKNDGMVRRVLTQFELDHGIDLRQSSVAIARVGEAVDRARVELRVCDTFDLYLPYLARSEAGPIDFEMRLGRADLLNYPQPAAGESYGERLAERRRNERRAYEERRSSGDKSRASALAEAQLTTPLAPEEALISGVAPPTLPNAMGNPAENKERAALNTTAPAQDEAIATNAQAPQVDQSKSAVPQSDRRRPMAPAPSPEIISGKAFVSKVRPLGGRIMQKVGRLRERLTRVDSLPEAALIDLRLRLAEIEKVTLGLSEVGVKFEEALFEVDETQVIRALSALEQRQRRRTGQGLEADPVLAGAIEEQRQLLKKMAKIDEDLARHLARMMALSAGCDSVALLLTQVGVAEDLRDVEQVGAVVIRLGNDVEAASQLLSDDILNYDPEEGRDETDPFKLLEAQKKKEEERLRDLTRRAAELQQGQGG